MVEHSVCGCCRVDGGHGWTMSEVPLLHEEQLRRRFCHFGAVVISVRQTMWCGTVILMTFLETLWYSNRISAVLDATTENISIKRNGQSQESLYALQSVLHSTNDLRVL